MRSRPKKRDHSIKRFSICFIIAFISSLPAFSASSEAEATATILSGVSITLGRTTHMQFGRIFPSISTTGTVVMEPDGDFNNSDGNLILVTGVGRYPAAFFAYLDSGEGTTFSITLPSTAATITNTTNSAATMTVDTFTCDLDDATGTLDEDGQCAFHVGATLHVGVSQTTGLYSGKFYVYLSSN